MSHIIEYVGREGVKTTPYRARTFQKPRPGDPVLWSSNDQVEHYACEAGTIGRIWGVGSGFCYPDEVHVCCQEGSVFLGEDYVSISGGPFRIIKLDRFHWEPAPGVKLVSFWNWGDHRPGADQGVTYHLERPLWRIKPLPPAEDR